jgi:hypothetical protein
MLALAPLLDQIRAVSILVGVGAFVWKSILFLHHATDTAKKIPLFMEQTTARLISIQGNVETAVTNHLSHIESATEKTSTSMGQLATFMAKMSDDFAEHVKKDDRVQADILTTLAVLKDRT